MFAVTRERIRQIESQGVAKVTSFVALGSIQNIFSRVRSRNTQDQGDGNEESFCRQYEFSNHGK